MNVWFDLASLYYWPQYFPVYQELVKRGHSCSVAIHMENNNCDVLNAFVASLPHGMNYEMVSGLSLAFFYNEKSPDWIIFGNDDFNDFSSLKINTKTALLYHGIGVKACYYSAGLSNFSVRFTEGKFRQKKLEELYPLSNFYEVGFAKLDPLFDPEYYQFNQLNLETIGLDSEKKTILYAPTFYPSSIECMPRNWPAKFKYYNIILKPHFFTWSNKKYHKQRELLLYWQSFENVYLAPAESVSLLPYMDVADLLLSEASSALFEFAALNKPVLWLDFLHLRWSYRGIFRYRFKKRMDNTINEYKDVALHVEKPKDLEASVFDQLNNIDSFKVQRKFVVDELIGVVDGRVSCRIVDYLERNKWMP